MFCRFRPVSFGEKDVMTNKQVLLHSWACFFIHACIEIICFAILSHTFGLSSFTKVMVYLAYDMVAFYPQFVGGLIHEKYPKLNIPSIAVAIMALGLLVLEYDTVSARSIAAVVLIAISNALLHDCCAIHTTLISKGKLFPSALFVAGGSFGVVIGQTLGNTPSFEKCHLFVILFIMWGLLLLTNHAWLREDYKYPVFNIVKPQKGNTFAIVAFSAYFVTFVRSYIGYAIPISWKKSLWQAFLLFFVMGVGKALGGYLADKFGAKKVGVYSTIACIPFLIFGENLMVVSILGIFFFSMTMSITFGMFLSIIPKNPGVAFGLTTLALGNGIMVPFAIGQISNTVNIILIVTLSLLCSWILSRTLKEEHV